MQADRITQHLLYGTEKIPPLTRQDQRLDRFQFGCNVHPGIRLINDLWRIFSAVEEKDSTSENDHKQRPGQECGIFLDL